MSCSVQAGPNAAAYDLAESQIQIHLATRHYDLAENHLRNHDVEEARTSYGQALEATKNALTSAKRGLTETSDLFDAASGASAENMEQAIARLTVANSGLLLAVEMLEIKFESPQTDQPTLGGTLSNITTELINGMMYAAMVGAP